MREKEKPVEIGKEYEVIVTNYGYNGEGVARLEKLAIFIDGGLVGETIKIKITELKQRFARAEIVEIIKKAEDRTLPVCPHYTSCGGCQLQHMSYESQLKFKRQQVVDQIERTAGLAGIKVLSTIGMTNPFNYRNKAQFPAGTVNGTKESGRGISTVLGFYKEGTHELIPISNCSIQHEKTNKINKLLNSFINRYEIPAYSEKDGSGFLRHVIVRTGFTSGEIMVVLVTNLEAEGGNNYGKIFSEQIKEALIDEFKAEIPGLKSIVQNINNKNTNKIMGEENITLWGNDYIEDYIGKLRFRISPHSFYQVNPVQTEVLYGKALEFAALTGNETVVDAYCGVGTISLFLSQKAQKVYGIEIIDAAIQDARINAQINGINNVEFITGKSEEIMPQILEREKIDVIVMDPPRKGCEREFLEASAKMKPSKMVYVSCNPATLARDLAILDKLGYKTVEVQPVDMFPGTWHVETVVKLEER